MLTAQEFADWLDYSVRWDEGEILVVMKVTVDESGTDDQAPCIAVAVCYALKPEHWREYKRDWSPTAKKYEDEGFHAVDADAADLQVLAKATANWLAGFALTIGYDDFDAVVPHRVRSQFGAEYATAIRVMLHSFTDYCLKNDILGGFTLVLESGHAEQPAVDKTLTATANARGPGGARSALWSHQWVGKEDITTHCADLFSHLAAPTRNGAHPPLLDELFRPNPIRKFYVHHMTRQELEAAVETLYEYKKWKRRHGPNPTSKKKLRARRLRRLRSWGLGFWRRFWYGVLRRPNRENQ